MFGDQISAATAHHCVHHPSIVHTSSAGIASVGGAVEQFVRAVAPELAPKRINVVSPGVIDTPMFGNDAEARGKMLAGATAKNLIPRAGTPEEVAAGIMFVVQNDFVTGTTIDVDGGWVHA